MNGTVTTTATNDEREREPRGAAPAPLRVGRGEQRGQRRGAELRRGGERDERSPRRRRAQCDQGADPEGRDQRVVGVGVHRVERPRARDPGERQRPAQGSPFGALAQAAAENRQPADACEVEEDRRRMRGGDPRVPDPVPREGELERYVGEVVERPVHIAAQIETEREHPLVEPLAVRDPVGPDDAGDADVDHVRVHDVEHDPRDDEDGDSARQPAHRRHRDQRPRALARAYPGDQHPDQQVPEHGIGERDRRRDLGAVEEEQRRPEADDHEQVQVQQPQRPLRVEERQ